jgi:hypothetical protein
VHAQRQRGGRRDGRRKRERARARERERERETEGKRERVQRECVDSDILIASNINSEVGKTGVNSLVWYLDGHLGRIDVIIHGVYV